MRDSRVMSHILCISLYLPWFSPQPFLEISSLDWEIGFVNINIVFVVGKKVDVY